MDIQAHPTINLATHIPPSAQPPAALEAAIVIAQNARHMLSQQPLADVMRKLIPAVSTILFQSQIQKLELHATMFTPEEAIVTKQQLGVQLSIIAINADTPARKPFGPYMGDPGSSIEQNNYTWLDKPARLAEILKNVRDQVPPGPHQESYSFSLSGMIVAMLEVFVKESAVYRNFMLRNLSISGHTGIIHPGFNYQLSGIYWQADNQNNVALAGKPH